MLPDLLSLAEPALPALDAIGNELPSLDSIGIPKPGVPAEEAHAAAMARGAKCRTCSLWGCQRGPVMPQIVPGASLLLVGEAPSKAEVEEGLPFVGQVGIILNRALQQGGLDRSQISVTSTILCRPPENKNLPDFVLGLKKAHKRKVDRAKAAAKAAGQKFDKSSVPPLTLPTDHCRPRLDADLLQTAPNTILAMGGMALQVVASLLGLAHGSQKVKSGQIHVAVIGRQHGAPVLLRGGEGQAKVLMSSYHPAAAMRGNREMMPIIEGEIAKAARIACRGGAIDWKEPDFIVSPTADQAVNVCDTLREWSARTNLPVMVDIETDSKYPHLAKLRCVGIGGLNVDGRGTDLIASIPVRNNDHSEYWRNTGEKVRVMRALHRLLNESKLAFQNGSYDTGVLWRVGLLGGDRNRQWDDTLLCHHDSDWSELPHDLGFMMSQFLEAPHHKDDADAKVVESVSSEDTRRYNVRDVLGQARLLPILYDRTVASGQLDAYRTDQALAPVARDMETLGLRVNQEKRIEHFLSQHTRAEKRLQILRTVTGRADFNPGSVHHVRDWLYEDLKLTPPFSTDGTDWEDVLKLQADQEAEMAKEGDEIDDPDDIPWIKDPATSEGALQALISSGVPAEVEQALNALLEYRGAKKLIGTYCGLRPVYDEKKLAEAKKKGRRAYTVQYEDKPLVVVDTSQIVWEQTPWGLLPFLHPHWNIGTVVTGRWSCNPNLQAVPEQPLNMRSIYEAVPDHRFVGADASQIELRLYTLFSGDRLLWPMFLDPKEDPHSYNFASMAAGHKGEAAVAAFYADMKAKRLAAKKAGGKDKVVELLRTIAKRFCVAEGEPVLVRRGVETLEVPIQDVMHSDEVWDGVEWVTHDGVVCNGVREVIEHDELWLTDDHEVWLATGEKVAFGEAARRSAALARTGEGRNPVRFVADVDGGVAEREASEGVGTLYLRKDSDNCSRRLESRQVARMLCLPPTKSDYAEVAAQSNGTGATAVREFARQMLEELRRAGYRVPLLVDRRGCNVDRGESRTAPRAGDRSDRHEWALRARQLALGNGSAASDEPARLDTACLVGLSTGRMAICAWGGREEAARGDDARTDHRRSQEVRSAPSRELVAPRRRTTRVYDILNAGPRRRFTAGGRLLHNCYLCLYGGEREKLYSVMSIERNIDGSLTFPGLKEADIKRWFDNFHQTHPEMRAWQQRVINGFKSNGCVRSIVDFRGRFFVGGFDRNAVINHAIQSSSAALINRSMRQVAAEYPYGKLSAFSGPVLQVHDYIGLQVPEEYAERAKAAVDAAMNVVVDGMPFPSESKSIATNWSQH